MQELHRETAPSALSEARRQGPALTWSERAGPNSGAIRNAAPLGCLNARDERMVDGGGAAGSRRLTALDGTYSALRSSSMIDRSRISTSGWGTSMSEDAIFSWIC